MNQVSAQEPKVEDKNIQQQNAVVPNQEPVVTVEETPQEINWKKFKEARELDRKRAEEQQKRADEKTAEAEALKAAMEAILNKQSNGSRQSSDSQYSNNGFDEESEEARIDKKVEAALKARESQYEAQRAQKEREEYPTKLNQTFSDFNQVCSASNLDYLDYHYPEISTAFKHMPEGFDKWAAVYKAVKRFIPNSDSQKDQKKAEANFNKPQSMSSNGLAEGRGAMPSVKLDDQRRADNWARMQKILKGIN